MKYKVLTLAIFILTSIFTGVSSVDATETIITEGSSSSSASVQIKADVESAFTVLIPKTVVLTKASDDKHYEADYSVKVVNADVRPDQILHVSVPNTISMSEASIGASSATAVENLLNDGSNLSRVTDSYLACNTASATFNYKATEEREVANINNYANEGTIFTAGSWSGTQTFTVALETVALEEAPGIYGATGILSTLSKAQVETDYSAVSTLPDTLGIDKTLVTKIILPKDASVIGSNAFDGCSNITSVKFANSYTTIKTKAFNGCTSLSSVVIPNTARTIASDAFTGAHAVTYDGPMSELPDDAPWGAGTIYCSN